MVQNLCVILKLNECSIGVWFVHKFNFRLKLNVTKLIYQLVITKKNYLRLRSNKIVTPCCHNFKVPRSIIFDELQAFCQGDF